MARNNGPLIPDEEVAARPGARASSTPDEPPDARFLDLDSEDSSPFLRGQKRVPAKRSAIPKKAAGRIKVAVVFLGVVVALAGASAFIVQYGEHSWRFRIESSDDLEVLGTQNVSKRQIMEVMGGDIGRNIFFIPLEQRKHQLEEIPWVESAYVERLLPNHLRVEIRERTPVAFTQVGAKIELIDANGVLMDPPAHDKSQYSFPVILGTGASEPLSTRAARMKIYSELIKELDADGAHYSADLSEVDLGDPEDVKVSVVDSQGEVLVHLGSSDFATRFKIYKAHVQEWHQQFPRLDSVDLRYDRQVIVNPDTVKEEKPVEHKAAVVPKPKRAPWKRRR